MAEYEETYGEIPAAAPELPEADQGIWIVFLFAWAILVASGLFLLSRGYLLPAATLIGPITILAVMWRPLFGLCLVFAVLPVGGLGVGNVLSGDRMVASLFALGVVAHMMLYGKRFAFRYTIIGVLLSLSVLSLLSLLWSPYATYVWQLPVAAIQYTLMGVLLLTVWAYYPDVIWPLRTFILSCLVVGVSARFLGLAYTFGRYERFTLSLGGEQAINANSMGFIFALSLFASIYLVARDPVRKLRVLWLLCIPAMLILALMTGSRKAAYGIVLVLVLPVVFLREAFRRPALWVALLVMLLVTAGAVLLGSRLFPAQFGRITSTEYLRESYDVRRSFIREGLAFLAANPLGAGIQSFFTGGGKQIHNDFFYCLVNLGYLGGLIYIWLAVWAVLSVWGMQIGWEKWLCRAIVAFALFEGLGGVWLFDKPYWFFLVLAAMLAKVHRRLREGAYGGEMLPAEPPLVSRA